MDKEAIPELTLEEMIANKANLLKEYKALEEDIDFAEDDFEEARVMKIRDKLATQIKEYGVKIREIESL